MSRPIQITSLISAVMFVLAGTLGNHFYQHATLGWTWRTIGSPISILIGLIILTIMSANSIPKEEQPSTSSSM